MSRRTEVVVIILFGVGFGLLPMFLSQTRFSRVHLACNLYLPNPVATSNGADATLEAWLRTDQPVVRFSGL